MTTAWIILTTIACYFALLVWLSWLRGRRADNAAFFTGGRSSSWLMATLAMIGASISGVTFISVPGAVGTGGYAYMQMVLGFFVGAIVVALVLIPLFYRMNLTSIYGYLGQRFGGISCRTGAWIFFVSKMLGASVRFFVVCAVLQPLVFEPLQVPFALGVVGTVALIWLYSFRGGVKSMIGTDVLKTVCLVASVVCCIGCIAHSLHLGAGELPGSIARHSTSRVFFFDNPDDGRYFWKQFLAGIFLMIATTGLDQDLMQRTLSCRNPRDAQKNMVLSAFVQLFVIGLFLVLGTLLYMYADARLSDASIAGDALFGRVVWSKDFPLAVGIVFIVGLIAAAYSAAGSALTALTTSFTVDILKADKRQDEQHLTRTRRLVHILMSLLMVAVIIVFYELNDDSAINAVYNLAAYTYGPLLGMFGFGLACQRPVRDRWVPIVVLASPIFCYVLQSHSEAWFGGWQISFELLIINAAVTALGLWLISRKHSSINHNRHVSSI